MDMFVLFAIIFLSVLFGLALSAILLSLFFRLILRLSRARGPQALAAAAATSQTQRG